jgi:hypothetical protein
MLLASYPPGEQPTQASGPFGHPFRRAGAGGEVVRNGGIYVLGRGVGPMTMSLGYWGRSNSLSGRRPGPSDSA